MVTKCDVFSLKVQKAGTLKALLKEPSNREPPNHHNTGCYLYRRCGLVFERSDSAIGSARNEQKPLVTPECN